jgi:tetratricopeptide (TPR) repeat protein
MPSKTQKAIRQRNPAAPATAGRVTGWKLWCFRLAVTVGAPLAFFAFLELSLRLIGYGYPTAFLLPASQDGQKVFVQNNQFGWRFFGPQMSRLPEPLALTQAKAPDTVRVLVFGESAAAGEPQPEFGLPRMLNAMLSLRHPGVRFEVVNAAMTAINSHTVRAIARDCARADGDIWVLYMGNNEVIGPFGAGTVFGSRTLPLPVIRTALAAKSTRTGQLSESLLRWARKSRPEMDEWGGMAMFLAQQVRADDPRMNSVYHHFERNLADIIRAGRRNGAGLVVSTVAVNLKDCPPLASAHRPRLSEPEKRKWELLYQLGFKSQDAGNSQEAAERFHEAAQIDDTFADLPFRQGQCALALRDLRAAQGYFRVARDLDTLRFRCDSKLNELTRHATSNREDDHILLADAERAFAEQSPDGLPGQDLFYEHVHLTFAGNYLLARTIAGQVGKLLPERVKARGEANQPWPSVADCARRLAWSDWDQARALSAITARLSQPPFTAQLGHDTQMRCLKASLEALAPATHSAGISNALRACESALAALPDDGPLYTQLESLKNASGDLPGATAAARREVELLLSDPVGWHRLGSILLRQQRFEDASAAFHRAFQLDPQDVESLQNLAQSLAALGRHEDAIREYRRALAMKPHFGLAWIGLGQVLEKLGRKAEAEDCYHRALSNTVRRLADLTQLADFCYGRKWLDAAVYYFDEAIRLSPLDARLHIGAAESLATLGRSAEAAQHSAEAVRLAPGLARAHLTYGIVLGQQGQLAEATKQLREALRLQPEMLDARLNLAVALTREGHLDEAYAQLQAVLQRSPTNELALKYIQLLTSPSPDPARGP